MDQEAPGTACWLHVGGSRGACSLREPEEMLPRAGSAEARCIKYDPSLRLSSGGLTRSQHLHLLVHTLPM